MARGKEHLALGVDHAVVSLHHTCDVLLHDIREFGNLVEEYLQVILIFDAPGGQRADAAVGLYDHGIAYFGDELLRGVQVHDRRIARSGDTCHLVIFFHGRLGAVTHDLVGPKPRHDIEIRAEGGVQLHPVLIVGLDPVDLAVTERKIPHRADHLVVVLHVFHPVVLGQGVFECIAQGVVRRVAYSEDVGAVLFEPEAEALIGSGEVWRYKHKIHKNLRLNPVFFTL